MLHLIVDRTRDSQIFLEGSAMGMRFVGLDLRDILSLGYQDLPVANLRRIMNTALF